MHPYPAPMRPSVPPRPAALIEGAGCSAGLSLMGAVWLATSCLWLLFGGMVVLVGERNETLAVAVSWVLYTVVIGYAALCAVALRKHGKHGWPTAVAWVGVAVACTPIAVFFISLN